MQQATPLMQRQQREDPNQTRPKPQRQRPESTRPLPNLADVVDGLNAPTRNPEAQIRQGLDRVSERTGRVEDAIEQGNQERNRSDRESIDETKKSNGLLSRIVKNAQERALDKGNEGLDNSKEALKGSFGEFGLLAQNSLKSVYSLYKKMKAEEDEPATPSRRTRQPGPTVEPAEPPTPVNQPRPTPTPTIDPPAPTPAPVPPTPAPRVWGPRPPSPAPTIERAPPTPPRQPDVVRVAPTPVERVPSPVDRPAPRTYPAMERIWKGRTTPPTQESPQEAPQPSTGPSKIERKGKTPQQVRIERTHRREGIQASDKEEPTAERLNRKQRKAAQLEAKRSGDEEPIKEVKEMNESLERLVKISEDQLKQQKASDLAKNSDELQASSNTRRPDTAPDLKDNKEAKKAGGLFNGVLGSLLSGLIGSVTGGGILGVLGGIFATATKTVGALFKPVAGFIKTMARNGKLIPVIGQVVAVVSAVFDFFSGWNDAAKILGKDGELITLWDKFSAGVGSVLGGFAGIIDSVLGFFDVETKFEQTVKEGVAKFLSDLPKKIGDMFSSIVAGIDDLTGGFASTYIEAVKSFWTNSLKSVLSAIPGGSKISEFLGLDKKDKAPKPEIKPAAKSTASFAPRAEANAALFRSDDRSTKAPPASTVVAPTNNTQVVNNTSYMSSNLSTRDVGGDSHRYGLSG